MRLATITNWAYGATVALTLSAGATMLAAAGAQQRERAAVALRYELDAATSSLDEDAASLSGLARQFAISGRAADLAAYRRELAGLGPVEERTRQIRDAGAGVDELAALHDALRWTDALQAQQQAAIAAREKGDKAGALEIVFSAEYERELDRILGEIQRFQSRIDQRTDNALQAAADGARLWQTVSEAMMAVTGLLFFFVLFFVFRNRVLRPVTKLSDVVKRLAAEDYDAAPPRLTQVDEIGDMAEALRVFRDTGLERQRLERERDAELAFRDLLSRMTQRMQSCGGVAELGEVVRRFLPEIAPELAGRLYLLDPARNALVEATSWGGPVHSRAEFPPLACWALRRGGPHRPAGDPIDVPCGHLEPAEGGARDTLCLPLAGRNGPLGLLYLEARAGAEAGRLSETYLRLLAENVGLALDNLRLREALEGMALADALTSLANRRQLDVVLQTELDRSARDDTAISCVMADIDHFKRFNDEFGHDAGDAVLQAVGGALKTAVREGALVFRYGGEEFLLLMPGLGPEDAGSRAEEIRSAISGLRVRHEGRDLPPVTLSLGVASAPAHGARDRLVACADAALLRAKREGRDRVAVAVPRAAARKRA